MPTQEKGSLRFDSHSSINFCVKSGDCFFLDFSDDPKEFASELRELAAFMERHAGEEILAEVD